VCKICKFWGTTDYPTKGTHFAMKLNGNQNCYQHCSKYLFLCFAGTTWWCINDDRFLGELTL